MLAILNNCAWNEGCWTSERETCCLSACVVVVVVVVVSTVIMRLWCVERTQQLSCLLDYFMQLARGRAAWMSMDVAISIPAQLQDCCIPPLSKLSTCTPSTIL